MSPGAVRKMFAAADTDGDGVITFEEFESICLRFDFFCGYFSYSTAVGLVP